MKNQKILVFCSFLCISVLSACFSPWGPDTIKDVEYTVFLSPTGNDRIVDRIPIKSTRTTPIVITVPEGEWEIDIEAEATGDGWSSFAERPPKFFGTAWVKNDKEEKVTIDTSAMNPSIQVKGWGQLSKAFNGDWDKFLKEVGWKSKSKPQEYYIEIIDTTSTDATTSAILDGDSDKNIILSTKENVTIQRHTSLTDPLFRINKGTLTLGKEKDQGTITIQGNKNTGNDSLITVFGELIMKDKVTLTGNKKTEMHNYSDPNIGGGGVYVGTNGKFIMDGGNILDNETTGNGGGVRVRGGTFIMYKGTISDNTANVGGGVRVSTNGTFIIHTGTISGNTATSSASNGGGGVSYYPGTYQNKNGNVTSNTPATSQEKEESN